MLTKSDIITEKVVRDHLVDLGYSPDALSPEAMEEFIAELKELYSGHFQEGKTDNGDCHEESETNPPHPFSNSAEFESCLAVEVKSTNNSSKISKSLEI